MIFAIAYQNRGTATPRGGALVELTVDEGALCHFVDESDGDPKCKHCRGRAVAELVRDKAAQLGLQPAGLLEAQVCEVSDDPRLSDSDGNKAIPSDMVAALFWGGTCLSSVN